MYLGRVIGTVVATRRVSGLEGARFLVVQPVDHTAEALGPRRGGGRSRLRQPRHAW